MGALFRLYTTNRCDAVLNLLFRPTPDAYCHFYFPNAIKFVFHNHHLFKWLLVLIPDFGLLNQNKKPIFCGLRVENMHR